jgi:hypothetical protein
MKEKTFRSVVFYLLLTILILLIGVGVLVFLYVGPGASPNTVTAPPFSAADLDDVGPLADCLPDLPEHLAVQYQWTDGLGMTWAQPESPTCSNKIQMTRLLNSADDELLCEARGNPYCDITGLTAGQSIRVKAQNMNGKGWGGVSSAIEVTVPGLAASFEGRCANRADGRWFVDSNGYDPQLFTNAAAECGKSNFGGAAGTISCLRDWTSGDANKPPGYSDMSRLSDSCLVCFGRSAECGRSNCSVSCMLDLYSKSCIDCNRRYCNPATQACIANDQAFVNSQSPPEPSRS